MCPRPFNIFGKSTEMAGNFNNIYRARLFLLVVVVLFTSAKQITAQSAGRKEFKSVLADGMIAFIKPYGDWIMDSDQLMLLVENERENRTNIWLKNDYENFVLELDFNVNAGTNSGIFIRTSDIANPVQTGIEVQIRDDYGKGPVDMHFCGSIYDIKEVSENRVRKPGEWNYLKVISKGTSLKVFLNKGKVIDIDLKDWEEAGKNPDGTENKFKTAYKEMAGKGKIGFQDHGGKVWYRNIRIKEH
jgi:hypothetical protein